MAVKYIMREATQKVISPRIECLKQHLRRNRIGDAARCVATAALLAITPLPQLTNSLPITAATAPIESRNWAGEEAEGGKLNFVGVSTDFTVPKIDAGCDVYKATRDSGSEYRVASYPVLGIWVGLIRDGPAKEHGPSLVQIGIFGKYIASHGGENSGHSQEDMRGKQIYKAFYQLRDDSRDRVLDDFVIRPGDVIGMNVERLRVADNTFRLSIMNRSRKGVARSIDISYGEEAKNSAPRFSAALIVERPSVNESSVFHPLAGFGSVAFTNASVRYEDENGQIENTSLGASGATPIEMSGMTKYGNFYLLAAPSVLSSDGKKFNVTDQYCSAAST